MVRSTWAAILFLFVLRTFYTTKHGTTLIYNEEKEHIREEKDVIKAGLHALSVIDFCFVSKISKNRRERREWTRIVRKRKNQRHMVRATLYYFIVILLASGDLELNPGPTKYPCGECTKPVKSNQKGIACDACIKWFHIKCLPSSSRITDAEYRKYQIDENLSWECPSCQFPHLEDDSYFDPSISSMDLSQMSVASHDEDQCDPYEGIKDYRKKHPKNLVIMHININSFRYKYNLLLDILRQRYIDVLFINETKLDDSFPTAQFNINGYNLYRKDRNINGGGLMAYVHDSIPSRMRDQPETSALESMALELKMDGDRWLIIGGYRPPSTSPIAFDHDANILIEWHVKDFDKLCFVGDLNLDMLSPNKGKALNDVIENFAMKNLITTATCFTKGAAPSLVDVFLTTHPDCFFKSSVVDIGLSDVHHAVLVALKSEREIQKGKKVAYRSLKGLNEDDLLSDLSKVPFHVAEIFDDVNDVYWAHEKLLTEVIDAHAPIKHRKKRQKEAPFMTGPLRKEINYKRSLHRKFLKYKNSKNWERYRVQRNKITKMKRQCIKDYFLERCSGGPKSTDFWPTIRPFLTNKGSHHDCVTTLCEEDHVINDQDEVCKIFNDFFVNSAKDIGSSMANQDVHDHPSIETIRDILGDSGKKFSFQMVSAAEVHKCLDQISVRKATGLDNLSAKLLKIVEPVILQPLTNIVNRTLVDGRFPDQLKVARVTPIHKKNDKLDKKNYRPVSVLPIISKVFERCISNQLVKYFGSIFDPRLSAYRAGYSCETVLLSITEELRQAIDRKDHAGAILMDLSKAFDCLPHRLVVEKLRAYGLDQTAVLLLKDYLSNRKQCVKIGGFTSPFHSLAKGIPQGSILGPLIFNIFLNDIFKCVQRSTLANYADDNTLIFAHKNKNTWKSTLEDEGAALVDWFASNGMQANPAKFQGIVFGPSSPDTGETSFIVKGASIECSENVKLLGVHLDSQLNFDKHISDMCIKAGRQLNVLKRIGRYLNLTCRRTIYYAFIRSVLNFCPLVWHFCSKKNQYKVERLNSRALRFVYQDFNSSYEDLLKKDDNVSLYLHRRRLLAIEVFKIVHGCRPSYLNDLISIKENVRYNFRHSKKAKLPDYNGKTYGKRNFQYEAAQLWNSLPQHVRIAENFGTFKHYISLWDGGACACSVCRYEAKSS